MQLEKEMPGLGGTALAQAEGRYDSPEGRAADAGNLEQRGIDSDLVSTRIRTDTSVAIPASKATAKTSKLTRESRQAEPGFNTPGQRAQA
jgi:hypothetical protein